MPTPSPIIMHRISENSGMSMTADITPTPVAPTKSPNSAVATGRPMASTEQQTTPIARPARKRRV